MLCRKRQMAAGQRREATLGAWDVSAIVLELGSNKKAKSI